MKKVVFDNVLVGETFKYSPAAISMVRINPRKSSYGSPCPNCGEPPETWVNAQEKDGVIGNHVCPDKWVYVANDTAAQETPQP